MSIINQRIVIDDPGELIRACDDFCYSLRALEQHLDHHGQIDLMFAEGLVHDLRVIMATFEPEIERAHEERRKYNEVHRSAEGGVCPEPPTALSAEAVSGGGAVSTGGPSQFAERGIEER